MRPVAIAPHRGRPRLAAGLLPLALLAAATGCGRRPAVPGPERAPIHDLATALPLAEVRGERAEIDLGTHRAAPRLVHGWSWNERSDDGTTWTWSLGRRSAVELFVARPRPLELTLRCRSYPFRDRSPQRVHLAVDGWPVGEVELPPRWREVTVPLPAGALRAGPNRLELRYRHVRWRTGGTGDRRPVAVACDRIAPGTREAEPPAAPSGGSRLVIPAGNQVDWFLHLPAAAELSVPRLDLPADGSVELFAGLTREGGEERTVARLSTPAEGLRFDFGDESGVVRLRLRVTGRRAEPGVGGQAGRGAATLTAPVVDAPGRSAPGGRDAVGRGAVDRGAADRGAPDRARTPTAVRDAPPSPVILYVVDTLRADRLGAYGNERPLTPRLDALAAEAVLFRHAVAQSSWTLPSMASVFTGRHPWVHGAVTKESRIAGGLDTLPRWLRQAGWATWAVVANGFVGEGFGFAAGFDRFAMVSPLDTRAEELHRRAFAWLDAGLPDSPLFLYLHAIDPHTSWDPPADLRRRFAPAVSDPKLGSRETVDALEAGRLESSPRMVADQRALYDAEVASADRQLGAFLDGLRRRGLYDDALLLFLSDHGEELHDRGSWMHGHTLHAELLDVPLLVRFPGGRHGGTVVEAPVQHVDLLPTLADLLALPAPENLPGDSLLPLVADAGGGGGEPPRPVVSFLAPRTYAVTEGRWKLILDAGDGWRAGGRLYDRRSDPGERRNLVAERPVRAGHLAARLRAVLAEEAPARAAERAEIDRETREHLEALGYLDP